MAVLEEVLSLDMESFFQYVRGIGDREHRGFLSSEAVVRGNAGRCWELAELTMDYALSRGLEARSYLMRYRDKLRAQVFLCDSGLWIPVPDNSPDLALGGQVFEDLDSCVEWVTDLYRGYLRGVYGDDYDEDSLTVLEYARTNPEESGEEFF